MAPPPTLPRPKVAIPPPPEPPKAPEPPYPMDGLPSDEEPLRYGLPFETPKLKPVKRPYDFVPDRCVMVLHLCMAHSDSIMQIMVAVVAN